VNANENAADAVQLSDPGSGLFARATNGGDAGSLTINALALNAQDGAQVTVSSPQGRAGNLTATAYTILLDQGKLTAITGAGSGGNIRLQNLDLLRMLDMSLISAEAFRAANGGNINIDTQWLVAVPKNSDIIANAIRGNGGRVDITASGIFGLQYRDRLTPESDITASSEFGVDGVVTLNTPDVDPSQGLVSLPVELVDASNSIATGCAAGGENEFIITGRGGLPPSPSDTLSSDTVWSDLRSNPKFARTPSSSEEATNPILPQPAPIVEATGWVINNKGEVVLTATAPTATRDIPWIRPDACHTP
jgi:large exoprotein involved in heme utilization and adhesion